MDNSDAFWRYNETGEISPATNDEGASSVAWRRRVERWQPQTIRRKPMVIREREAHVLQLLIEAEGTPIHVQAIAKSIGLSVSATTQFLYSYGDGLWTNQGAYWKTMFRDIPTRLES